jgi:hypothetical protein
MVHAADLDGVVRGVDKEEPVVADPEPQFFSIALERFEVPGAGPDEAVQGMEHAYGCGLVQFTDIGLGWVGPLDALHAGSR